MTELLVAPAGGNGRSVATELLAQMEVERPTSLSVEPHTADVSPGTPARWHLFLTSACHPSWHGVRRHHLSDAVISSFLQRANECGAGS